MPLLKSGFGLKSIDKTSYTSCPEFPDNSSIIHEPLCGEFIEHLGVGVGFDGRVHFVIDGGVNVVGVTCHPVQPLHLLGRGGVRQLAHRIQILSRTAGNLHIAQGNF